MKEIRTITQRTFSAVEGTVAETERLESQGRHVVEASRQVSLRVEEVTKAAVEQAEGGRQLVRHLYESLLHRASSASIGLRPASA